MNRIKYFSILALLFIIFVTSFTGCGLNKKPEALAKQQVIFQHLLNNKKINIYGTLNQFRLPEKGISGLSDLISTKFLNTFEHEALNSLFEISTISLTGKVPFLESFETENTELSNEYYRGYIQTDTTHYEGIFLINKTENEANFSICTSSSF
ncbi:MAG: hypothetical protein KAH01_01110 [Caldisericia bacterium]|nr:hypothetical protein [Caldisericia bacterium]